MANEAGATGRIFQITSDGADITGFDPARDKLDLGPVTVHNGIIVDTPIPLTSSGDRHADVVTLTTTLNQVMETYIREHPGQWLWVHKRWPD